MTSPNDTKLSLWLIPKPCPFTSSLQTFINKTLPTKHFSDQPHQEFSPHVTLTSPITLSSTDSSNPQNWLDHLTLPSEFRKESNEVIAELAAVESGDKFFQKLLIKVASNDNLRLLASSLREQILQTSQPDAAKWAQEEFYPHLSLFYGEISQSQVERRMAKVELDLGFELGSLFDCCGGALSMGAKLVLVDTTSEVKDWKVCAEREVDWVCWRMGRGLV